MTYPEGSTEKSEHFNKSLRSEPTENEENKLSISSFPQVRYKGIFICYRLPKTFYEKYEEKEVALLPKQVYALLIRSLTDFFEYKIPIMSYSC